MTQDLVISGMALICAPPPTVSNFHHLFSSSVSVSFSPDIPALIRVRRLCICFPCPFSSADKRARRGRTDGDQVFDLEEEEGGAPCRRRRGGRCRRRRRRGPDRPDRLSRRHRWLLAVTCTPPPRPDSTNRSAR